MSDYPIQQAFLFSYDSYCRKGNYQSDVQQKAAQAVLHCKSGSLGYNISVCEDCGHTEIHNNSCHNRNCPDCQAVNKEIWVDKRRAEVIDSPYFHVVFTLPHELNPLLCCNQKLLYGLFHRCCAETLLELSRNPKYLGVTPGIIQVLHTWNQELLYHVHMHCIVSGGGLTSDRKIRKSKGNFLSLFMFSGISSRENFLLYWMTSVSVDSLIFLPHVLFFRLFLTGRSSNMICTKKNGVLISKKLLTFLAMPLSILVNIRIR